MTPTTTVTSLIATLRERGYRAELFPSDPPHTKFDAAMIWYEPHDRYQATRCGLPTETMGGSGAAASSTRLPQAFQSVNWQTGC